MRNLKLTIEYDGSNYAGWQKQPNGTAIQQIVQVALQEMTQADIKLLASGRTDKGVHALGQVATFKTERLIKCSSFLKGLNSLLPSDISIKKVEEVAASFHPIHSAKKKTYCYLILNSACDSALLQKRAWHIPQKLDLKQMRKAAKHFKGTHDFTSFMGANSAIKDAVRKISQFKIAKLAHAFFGVGPQMEKQLICITVEGSGFVKYQVRNMVGTLLNVGLGKNQPSDIAQMLALKNRQATKCD